MEAKKQEEISIILYKLKFMEITDFIKKEDITIIFHEKYSIGKYFKNKNELAKLDLKNLSVIKNFQLN